jgi:hypothetical protein
MAANFCSGFRKSLRAWFSELPFEGFIATGGSRPERDIVGSVATSLDGDFYVFAFVEVVTGNGNIQRSRTNYDCASRHHVYTGH